MRNRTEQVTTKIEGSDFEEEGSDFDDSGDDWKPVEGEVAGVKPKKVKASSKSPGSAKKRPATARPSRASASKKKKESSDEEEEDEDDEEGGEEEESENEEESEGDEDEEPTKKGKGKRKTSSKGSVDDSESNSSMTQSSTRKSTTASRAIPDKLGVMTLYLHKGDAGESVKGNEKLFIWRRDGSSLLQKYTRDPENKDEVILNPTMVYSCWEDKRKDEYIEVRVQVFGDKKVGKVKVLNLEEVEAAASGKPLAAGNGQTNSTPSATVTSGAATDGANGVPAPGGGEEEEDEGDEDEEEDEEEE